MEYYSATENWNDAICSNTDGPRGYYTKEDRERHMSYDSTSVWNLKNNPDEFIHKKQIHGYQKEKFRGRHKLGAWD